MTYPTVLTLIFASFLCCIAADKGLHLKGYSEGGVEGCYEHSQDLAVCFDVKKDSMLIKKASGEGIVHLFTRNSAQICFFTKFWMTLLSGRLN